MSAAENVDLVRAMFRAIEERDAARLLELVDPAAEFHWPPSLPYGGVVPLQPVTGPSWAGTWLPLQPTEAEQRMDARVVAATDDEVVALWHQRGVAPSGERCDVPVLALYAVRGGKLTRAEMFYFDSTALGRFLARAAAA
jgi:ketosteroid isomerase-like protein